MKFRKYKKEQLIEAVANSTSIAQTLNKLGVIPAGGNYQVIKKYIQKLSLDTSHFNGQAWCKGKRIGPKRPIMDYLSNNYPIQSYKLKNRLIADKILNHLCYGCGLTSWLSQDIPLELHHIDGNHLNNQLCNLTLYCPNCHALTNNYRGKNKSNRT